MTHEHAHDDVHDRGLAFDLETLMARRTALRLFAGAGLMTLVGCGSAASPSASSTTAAASTSSTAAGASASSAAAGATAPSAGGAATTDGSSAAAVSAEVTCEAQVPTETGGPFPGDGSNGPNILAESGVVRSDIRSSIGGASGTAEGVPLQLNFKLLDRSKNCAPYAGAAMYAWHADRDGQYSMYSPAVAAENYLRGVQEAAADGSMSFTTVFPGCYSGRWPHVHFEIYASAADATSGASPLVTSQLAMPIDACQTVYATPGYEASLANLAGTSLDSDMVFSDGYDSQLGLSAGDPAAGFSVALNVFV